MQRRNQRGAALITAIFITAICAILATAIAFQLHLLINRSELNFTSDQAYLDLQGVQDWGLQSVLQYAQLADKKNLTAAPKLDSQFAAKKLQGATITGNIVDQQGLYNINNLALSANQPEFAALVQALDPRINQRDALTLAKNVTAWITDNQASEIYLNNNPPYRAANKPLVQVSMLRAIAGFNADIYLKLKPYLTALPLSGTQATSINVNSVSAPVLMTLNPGVITLNKAKDIVACVKQQGGFASVQDFNTQCVTRLGVPALKNVTVTSQYFLIHGQADLGQTQMVLNSLVVTSVQKDNTINTRVVWQALN